MMINMTAIRVVAVEVVVRIFLLVIYFKCQTSMPVARVLQPEELWHHRYPHMDSYVPMEAVWVVAVVLPFSVIALHCLFVRPQSSDAVYAPACASLVIILNAAITNVIKLVAGRPRPDFLARCYPSGIPEGDCTGDLHLVMDGRKSFPSGHSSVSFASATFICLYLTAKLRLLSASPPRTTAACLVLVISPLLASLCVAISRTLDYHHHWQDVCVGSLLGITIGWVCYYQYFPSLYHENCHLPLADMTDQRSCQQKPLSETTALLRIKEV